MYEIKRSSNIVEKLKLGDEVLEINISPAAIAQQYNKAQAEIIKAQDLIRQAQPPSQVPAEILEQYGAAIVNLLSLLLGQENTEKMLTFYENDYIEMTQEVLPFVFDVIAPKLESEVSRIRQRTRETYKKGKYGSKWNLGSKILK